ncbi:MAG: hypothetical protein ACK4K0_01190 [Flavobacteriales bacterium]
MAEYYRQMNMLRNSKLLFFTALLSPVIITSCGGSSSEGNEDLVNVEDTYIDPNQNIGIELDGQMFSIPSPIQTAMLIQKVGANYNPKMLNGNDKLANYSTIYQKALNLGLYGADLGYVTIYNKDDESINYLKTIRTLTDQLGITGAFDEEIVNRFTNNRGNQDSLLVIVSDAYKSADTYLKNNDKNDVVALILAGGWIESMYFAVTVAEETKNQEMITRVADQKNILGNLIELISYHRTTEEYEKLIFELEDLYAYFENIKYTYEFIAPVTNEEKRTTEIMSKTNIEISDEDLQGITNKVKSIRNEITR